MVTSIAATRSKPHKRRYQPFVLDILSLVLVSATMIAFIDSVEHKIVLLVLIISSSFNYLALLQSSHHPMKLRRPTNRLLLTPTLAALLSVITLFAFGLTFPLYWILAFCLIWTALMLLTRLLFSHTQPQLRLAVIGSETLLPVEDSSLVSIDVLPSPTTMFHAWDAIVMDPKQSYNAEWLTWLAHANMVGIPTLSKLSALEQITGTLSTSDLKRTWMRDVLKSAQSYELVKRCFDVVATLLLLPLLLPLCFVVSLLVYLDGGKPILFFQERVGKKGRPFSMVKFRSMRKDAEKEGAKFAGQGDHRITKLGHLLRKYRLDELPQFWNVLKGDMSIIGPRPEQKAFVENFNESIHLYDLRHQVNPGITGWAQVHQGYAAGEDETNTKLSYDLYYVKNLSLILDARIVLKTIRTILTGFGAR